MNDKDDQETNQTVPDEATDRTETGEAKAETGEAKAETADSAAVLESTPAQGKKKKNVKKEIISWILTLGSAVIIALLIRSFLFEPIYVDGQSMSDSYTVTLPARVPRPLVEFP